MQSERIRQLKEWLAESPNDPFLIYALATEYRSTDWQEARYYFEKLLTDHPDYAPTYYHAAALWAQIGETEKAASIYLKGLEVCKLQGDRKAWAELNAAWESWKEEWE
jgi:uncharacterized protein HemY